MKRALIFGYVVGVLLFSAFARAEVQSTELAISNVAYQKGSWSISLTGPLKNMCLTSPRPTLAVSADKPNHLILSVVADQKGELCAQAIRGNYALDVDLRDLVRKSGLNLAPSAQYKILIPQLGFEVEFAGRDVATVVNGTLLATRNGQLAIATTENKLVLVDDSQVDCEQYVNQMVSVVGRVSSTPSREYTIQPIKRLMVIEIQPLVK